MRQYGCTPLQLCSACAMSSQSSPAYQHSSWSSIWAVSYQCTPESLLSHGSGAHGMNLSAANPATEFCVGREKKEEGEVKQQQCSPPGLQSHAKVVALATDCANMLVSSKNPQQIQISSTAHCVCNTAKGGGYTPLTSLLDPLIFCTNLKTKQSNSKQSNCPLETCLLPASSFPVPNKC